MINPPTHLRSAALTVATLFVALIALVVFPVAPVGATVRAGPAPSAWTWPVAGNPEVVRGFEPPAAPWSAGHRGVDLLTTAGSPVLAAGSGVVSYAGRVAGRGVISVVHGSLRTTYEPVRPTVAVGARVQAGTVVGHLEGRPSHCAPRSCLHWGLLRGDIYLDPLLLVGRGRVRLLPFWDTPWPGQARGDSLTAQRAPLLDQEGQGAAALASPSRPPNALHADTSPPLSRPPLGDAANGNRAAGPQTQPPEAAAAQAGGLPWEAGPGALAIVGTAVLAGAATVAWRRRPDQHPP